MEDRDRLFENDREWRKYLIDKFEDLEARTQKHGEAIASIRVWNLVFRLIGGALFGVVYGVLMLWMEYRVFQH